MSRLMVAVSFRSNYVVSMGLIARLFTYVKKMMVVEPPVPEGGLFVDFSSGYLPHGRSITGNITSNNGKSGTLMIRSRPNYTTAYDIDFSVSLTAEHFTSYVTLLSVEDIADVSEMVKDGWRIRVRGCRSGRWWMRSFVLSGASNQYQEQSIRLKSVVETLLQIGRTGQLPIFSSPIERTPPSPKD